MSVTYDDTIADRHSYSSDATELLVPTRPTVRSDLSINRNSSLVHPQFPYSTAAAAETDAAGIAIQILQVKQLTLCILA